MNDIVFQALVVQLLDCLYPNSASCSFRNTSVHACPEVDLNRTIGNNAIDTLSHVNFGETEITHEKFGASLDIKRCKNGNSSNEFRRDHMCKLSPNRI